MTREDVFGKSHTIISDQIEPAEVTDEYRTYGIRVELMYETEVSRDGASEWEMLYFDAPGTGDPSIRLDQLPELIEMLQRMHQQIFGRRHDE